MKIDTNYHESREAAKKKVIKIKLTQYDVNKIQIKE